MVTIWLDKPENHEPQFWTEVAPHLATMFARRLIKFAATDERKRQWASYTQENQVSTDPEFSALLAKVTLDHDRPTQWMLKSSELTQVSDILEGRYLAEDESRNPIEDQSLVERLAYIMDGCKAVRIYDRYLMYSPKQIWNLIYGGPDDDEIQDHRRDRSFMLIVRAMGRVGEHQGNTNRDGPSILQIFSPFVSQWDYEKWNGIKALNAEELREMLNNQGLQTEGNKKNLRRRLYDAFLKSEGYVDARSMIIDHIEGEWVRPNLRGAGLDEIELQFFDHSAESRKMLHDRFIMMPDSLTSYVASGGFNQQFSSVPGQARVTAEHIIRSPRGPGFDLDPGTYLLSVLTPDRLTDHQPRYDVRRQIQVS